MSTHTATTNLRFLLWEARVPKDAWPAELAAWLGCGRPRALALLGEEPPSAEELGVLAALRGINEDDLAVAELTAGLDVLRENLRCLAGRLEHGSKGELAAFVGVTAGTLSAWLAGKHPKERNLERIAESFGLPAGLDLNRDPLFLDPLAVADLERRAWLRRRVDDLPTETLRALFPALRRLLE